MNEYSHRLSKNLMKILSTIICLLVFLSRQCFAAGIVYVSNSNDTGAGSFRQAVIDSVAGSTISWISNGGESISLGSDLGSINADTILDVSASTSSVHISGSANKIPLSGTVTFKNNALSTTWTISSILSGSGSLTKTGAGNLTLTGINTYSNGTILNEGTLTINNNSALGTSTMTFNGGILQNAARFDFTRNITLNTGGGTFNTDSYTMQLSGALVGAGTLTKKGTGTLILSGTNNTYSGGTIVSSGTLQLGAANALPTLGSISVSNEAVFDLSGFTQTLGSYSNNGTLRIKLQPGITNLNITGNAALGGTLLLNYSPQVFLQGQTFTPITAGSVTGQFNRITSPAALSFIPTYNANSLLL